VGAQHPYIIPSGENLYDFPLKEFTRGKPSHPEALTLWNLVFYPPEKQ